MYGFRWGRLGGACQSQYVTIQEIPERYERFLTEPQKSLACFPVKPICVKIDAPHLGRIDA
jgi:hypothetical protein